MPMLINLQSVSRKRYTIATSLKRICMTAKGFLPAKGPRRPDANFSCLPSQSYMGKIFSLTSENPDRGIERLGIRELKIESHSPLVK
jgi:hypothetical protein